MERYRQRELRAQRRQPADPGHDPGRRYRDVAGAEAESAPVVERLDRAEHAVKVEQRLAHAHEHDVREPPAVGAESPSREPDLVDDLGDLEVTAEPELARRAERTPDGTPRLARDAQRVPL